MTKFIFISTLNHCVERPACPIPSGLKSSSAESSEEEDMFTEVEACRGLKDDR